MQKTSINIWGGKDLCLELSWLKQNSCGSMIPQSSPGHSYKFCHCTQGEPRTPRNEWNSVRKMNSGRGTTPVWASTEWVAKEHLEGLESRCSTTRTQQVSRLAWNYVKLAIQVGVIPLKHRLAQITMQIQSEVYYVNRQVRYITKNADNVASNRD